MTVRPSSGPEVPVVAIAGVLVMFGLLVSVLVALAVRPTAVALVPHEPHFTDLPSLQRFLGPSFTGRPYDERGLGPRVRCSAWIDEPDGLYVIIACATP